MLDSLLGRSKKEARLAAATSRASAWKEQCQRTEFEKHELEHMNVRYKAELEELRKQNEYMREQLSEHHRLREVLATTDKLSLEQLRSAVSNDTSSDTILRTVFYLINKRQESCETEESDIEASNGFKMAFKNGSVHALRKIKEDLLSLIAEAGSERSELKHTRSPFPTPMPRSEERNSQAI